MSTNAAAPSTAPVRSMFYHNVESLLPGKTGWCSHWAVVVNAYGVLQIDPGTEVFNHRQLVEASMFIEREANGELLATWDAELHPFGTYDHPPQDWPVVNIRCRGIRNENAET